MGREGEKLPRRIIITKYSKEGEYYAPGLFSGSIGKRFPITGSKDVEWSKGTLIDAKVHPSGTAVDLTIELDGD